MPYEVIAHTADLRLNVSGKTPEDLFREALRGMMSVLKADMHQLPVSLRQTVAVESPDRTALLVDFLSAVLSRAQIYREVYTDVHFRHFTEHALEAELTGAKVSEFDEDIKAVTYHEADVRKNERGEWETLLVFDI